MQALFGSGQMRRRISRLGQLGVVWVMATVGLLSNAGAQQLPQAPAKLSQGQVAWQFLQAVLRADYAAAYARLAPEIHQTVRFKQFEAAAHPLWKYGQQHHQPAIDLYKIGVRLGDGGASRLFYTFAFTADSSLKPPPVLLEVTFRDTASRVVLGFGARTAKAVRKSY